jgi:hypothetical protein
VVELYFKVTIGYYPIAGWRETVHEDGEVYFYNANTRARRAGRTRGPTSRKAPRPPGLAPVQLD